MLRTLVVVAVLLAAATAAVASAGSTGRTLIVYERPHSAAAFTGEGGT